ncbi:copper chaperone PCu(A)C [Vreelandella andesensis]|uniref:Copper chaperone PCu(A)C n=1 Tax=Vreelandella andesensis TaxID=447567 RepID=A0A3S0WPT6_9GAMM|nr:copper chaperone PCu(A)C [Halomonas andesensis]RUR34840.1 copper chaperone PCu(A)C [Halomonas andesensis]
MRISNLSLTATFAVTMALSTVMLAGVAQADTVTVEDPFVREVPPGSPATAAFMKLYNQSGVPVRLIDAQNSITEFTELHDHVVIDEVMQMRQIEAIEIPAYGETQLAPGGLHLMLIGLNQPARKGDSVSLSLMFDNGDVLEVEAPVRPVMPMHQ